MVTNIAAAGLITMDALPTTKPLDSPESIAAKKSAKNSFSRHVSRSSKSPDSKENRENEGYHDMPSTPLSALNSFALSSMDTVLKQDFLIRSFDFIESTERSELTDPFSSAVSSMLNSSFSFKYFIFSIFDCYFLPIHLTSV